MDYDKALDRVESYIELCEASRQFQATHLSGWGNDPEWRSIDASITEATPLMEKIAEQLDARLATLLRQPDAVIEHRNKLDAAIELRGVLRSRQEAAEILGPQGPKLAAANLHPAVWNHAAKRWSDGHRRDAIQAAATSVFDTLLASKLQRQHDTNGGYDLVGQAFSIKPPEPGERRLRFRGIDPAEYPST